MGAVAVHGLTKLTIVYRTTKPRATFFYFLFHPPYFEIQRLQKARLRRAWVGL